MIRLACCIALLLGGVMAFAGPAQAASFDCSKAGTPFEHAICDNPELSSADDLLAKTYATAIGGLSEAALAVIRGSQRNWLDYARRACTRDARPLLDGRYDERGVSCLVDVFRSRSRVLEASRMIEGIRFYPVGRFAALPDPYEADNPESSWPVAQHELALVQIDSDEAFARAFNDAVLAEGDVISSGLVAQGGPETVAEDASSDTSNAIAVQDLSGNRIGLRVSTYWYGHGAAHGNYSISWLHFLRDEQRWLEAGDIFGGKGWQKGLLTLVVEAAREEHGDALMLDDTSYIAESVIDPSRWDLSDPYGLIVQFQPYEISAYAYGAPTTRISWEALAPYLAEDADRYRYGY